MNRKFFWSVCVLTFLTVFSFSGAAYASATSTEPPDAKPVAEVVVNSGGINFLPKVNCEQILLTLSRPDGTVVGKVFPAGSQPNIELSGICDGSPYDGTYTYELRVSPVGAKKIRGPGNEESSLQQGQTNRPALTQAGHFLVQGGVIVNKSGPEGPARPMDVVHNDDVIITGSLCIGYDCLTDGTESFGADTIKLKENTMRIFFDDTSSAAGFPANDWRIVVNDASSGGGNYFSVEDTTEGSTPFKIEAGAPSSALYVDDAGRIGIGTATPIYDINIVKGDSPAIRLHQDTSYGWTEQKWDISGNEANFFIRDGTNGSKLPFRIQPNTPTNTITMKSDGNVGIGTWSPTYALEIDRTGTAANLICKQTDGASGCIVADASHVFIGAKTNHDFRLIANDSVKMTILTSGNVGIGTTSPTHLIHLSGGAYSDGATWTNSSSRQYKENISNLTLEEANDALEGLNPVKFNYKTNKDEEYIGFIAEDAPALVATKDRKGMSPMDVVAVLTKVLQDQQKTIAELKEKIAAIEKK
ncbi:MAG: tail fiber domain-containing protein [Candidatus Aminicenantes bacterium]|nr:tail fiber domain-containing protein [Candidatus Aminicenantes bacterium]